MHETEPKHIDAGKVIYFQDEIVSFRKYVYEFDSDKLKKKKITVSRTTSMVSCMIPNSGKFMSAGGETYLR